MILSLKKDFQISEHCTTVKTLREKAEGFDFLGRLGRVKNICHSIGLKSDQRAEADRSMLPALSDFRQLSKHIGNLHTILEDYRWVGRG